MKLTGPLSTLDKMIDCRGISESKSRVVSLILALSNPFVEIAKEIIYMAIPLPSTDSRRFVVSNKPNYVHKVQVNRFAKLARRNMIR